VLKGKERRAARKKTGIIFELFFGIKDRAVTFAVPN
jgi:hypothetical protein